mgnify:FL=1
MTNTKKMNGNAVKEEKKRFEPDILLIRQTAMSYVLLHDLTVEEAVSSAISLVDDLDIELGEALFGLDSPDEDDNKIRFV